VAQLAPGATGPHLGRAPRVQIHTTVVSRDVSRLEACQGCPFPSNLRYRTALFAGVLQVGGTESGRVCPIQLGQITAILAVERVESAGQSVRCLT